MIRRLTAISLLVTAILATVALWPTAAAFPDDEKTMVHVLNRMAFGARPGDVEHVRKIGLQRYIDEQLHPDRIPDSARSGRLAHLETIQLTSRAISEQYEQPMMEARREQRQQQIATGNDRARQSSQQPRRAPAQQQANGVMLELSEHKLLRAIYSERQLQEVLTDFWFNHFNVDARKGRGRFLLTEYEREAIRPHVFGRFRDLLGATAKSPAMLFYLDNWLSADPDGPHPAANQPRAGRLPGRRPGQPGLGRPRRGGLQPRQMPPQGQANNRRNGLNEN